MKKIFFYILTVAPFFALAQEPQPFTIKSKIGNFNAPSRAYLIYQLGSNRVIDSTEIASGSFTFTGKIVNPENAFIVMDPKGFDFTKLDSTSDVLNFYIDKGETDINSPDSVAKAKITGSQINTDYKKLTDQLNPLSVQARQLQVEARAATPAQQNSADFQNSAQAKLKQLQVSQKAIIKLFIQTNPDSYISLLALSSVGGPSPDPAELDPLYDGLSKRLKETETAKIFKTALDGIRKTAVGVPAPDFTQNDVNGTPVKLSSFRGKYVLVDFWASWCGPCRQENPNVVKAYNRFKDKNFTIIGVSLDRADGKTAWQSAIKSDGLNWTQVSDLKFWNNEVAGLYNIKSIPANFLIDPTGKIIARDLRGEDLENKLQDVLTK